MKLWASILFCLFFISVFANPAFSDEGVCNGDSCQALQDKDKTNDSSDSFSIKIVSNGGARTISSPFLFTKSDYVDYSEFLEKIKDLVGYKDYPVRSFSSVGQEITSFDELFHQVVENGHSLVLARANEYFVWPPEFVGRKIKLDCGETHHKERNLEIETLSISPRLFRISNFLNATEAQHIINVATPLLFDSTVGLYEKRELSSVRTSKQAWYPDDDDPIRNEIQKRIEICLSKVPTENAESMQILHYGVGGHYDAHHDYFDPASHPTFNESPHHKNNRQRLITVLFYLSDCEEGGETCFPWAEGYKENWDRTYKTCQGLKVYPKQGEAVMFYNLQPDGHMDAAFDSASLHGACDVIKGEKWAANSWIYNKPYGS